MIQRSLFNLSEFSNASMPCACATCVYIPELAMLCHTSEGRLDIGNYGHIVQLIARSHIAKGGMFCIVLYCSVYIVRVMKEMHEQ